MSEATVTLRRTPRELRDELETYIREDLIGPLFGEYEELDEAPVDRYLLGLLAPRDHGRASAVDGAAVMSDGAAPAVGRNGDALEDDEDDAPEVPVAEDELATGDVTGEEGAAEGRPAAVEQLTPSSFGLTFALAHDCDVLRIEARWGAYRREHSEEKLDDDGRPRRVWRRRPCGGVRDVPLPAAGRIADIVPDPDEPDVIVQGVVRRRGDHRLVTLFLINGQVSDGNSAPERWLAQAQLTVTSPQGRAIFVRRPIDVIGLAPEIDRAELRGLEMQYRDVAELAVGHGVAVEAEFDRQRSDHGTLLRTSAMPGADVPLSEAPVPADYAEDAAVAEPLAAAAKGLDMRTLAEAPRGALPGLLSPLVDAYEAWIDGQKRRIDDPAARLNGHEDAATRHIDDARRAADRMRAGIATLAEGDGDAVNDVADAFRFANHAMWQQRIHTLVAEERRKDPRLALHEAVERHDKPDNRSWRPFQLAFLLLNLPALADPAHVERSGDARQRRVDLLFFPTGGGKTEAYLGLTAFAIAIRRLQGVVGGRDGQDGVAVLMRYTLRLLTLQQFQRAAALLCACELRRRRLYGDGRTEAQRRWGATPMRIGLWVGRASTPNTTADAEEWVEQARKRGGSAPRTSSPMQLARCPWCGSELRAGQDVEVDRAQGRTLISCSDPRGACPFTPRNSPGEGLPVVVVDEEVYRLLPALVIATVDKLARMPWEGRVQALFGQVARYCPRHGYLTPSDADHPGQHQARGRYPPVRVERCDPLRPPDLVIQDELHLISGPLGSLVGLYETAVDELCGWDAGGTRTRPKVIASTATIRRAGDQVQRLFDRGLDVFPPPGIDARDSFFALQRDRPGEQDDKPGRRYLGVCAPGRRFKQVLIRVYVAQLRAAWRVLGNQPGEEADAYMTLVGYFNSLRELGGMRRLVEDDVQSRLYRADEASRGRLIIEELTSRKSAAEIPKVLDQLGVQRLTQERRARRTEADGPPAVDVLLATNMISVGVDVPRLGAMVVAGQPKSTSEYIQATSRVGRRYPGLVLTVYNWARPRDLSHYETFAHYHRTLYRQVEALSITPFAPRALDRGLTGVLASLLRLGGPEWNANEGARLVDGAAERARRAKRAITDRASRQLDPRAAEDVAHQVEVRLDAWGAEAAVGQRNLVYERRGKSDADVSLLKAPATERWSRWTVPMSMRNVENAVPLMLRPDGVGRAPEPWEAPEQPPPKPPTADELRRRA